MCVGGRGGAGGTSCDRLCMTAMSSISLLAHPVPRSLTSHCRTLSTSSGSSCA